MRPAVADVLTDTARVAGVPRGRRPAVVGPAVTRRAAGRPVSLTIGRPVVGPLDHPAGEVDRRRSPARAARPRPGRTGRRPCTRRAAWSSGTSASRPRSSVSGMWTAPSMWPCAHSDGSRTSRTVTPSGSGVGDVGDGRSVGTSIGGPLATSAACDIRRSASGLPPVWQVGQYCRDESAKRHLAHGVAADRARLAGAAVHREVGLLLALELAGGQAAPSARPRRRASVRIASYSVASSSSSALWRA